MPFGGVGRLRLGLLDAPFHFTHGLEVLTDPRAILRSEPALQPGDLLAHGIEEAGPPAERGMGDEDDEAGDINRPSIQQRVNQVAGQIGNVSSLPTQIQRETLEGAMAELRTEVNRLNVLVGATIPALNASLDAAQVPWTIGRPVPWTGGR